MPPASPLIVLLQTANTDLEAKQAAVLEARQGLNMAHSAMNASADTQRTAFNNLAGLVQTDLRRQRSLYHELRFRCALQSNAYPAGGRSTT